EQQQPGRANQDLGSDRGREERSANGTDRRAASIGRGERWRVGGGRGRHRGDYRPPLSTPQATAGAWHAVCWLARQRGWRRRCSTSCSVWWSAGSRAVGTRAEADERPPSRTSAARRSVPSRKASGSSTSRAASSRRHSRASPPSATAASVGAREPAATKRLTPLTKRP